MLELIYNRKPPRSAGKARGAIINDGYGEKTRKPDAIMLHDERVGRQIMRKRTIVAGVATLILLGINLWQIITIQPISMTGAQLALVVAGAVFVCLFTRDTGLSDEEKEFYDD